MPIPLHDITLNYIILAAGYINDMENYVISVFNVIYGNAVTKPHISPLSLSRCDLVSIGCFVETGTENRSHTSVEEDPE